jgi:hypothetical protein
MLSRLERDDRSKKSTMPKKLTNICDKEVTLKGRLIRIARLEGEKHTFPDSPEAMIAALRNSRARADIFTFLQGVSDPSPRFSYRVEYDNFAVLPVSTFEHWWDHQIRSYPRNRARQAEKRGVVLREVPFGDVLIQGICRIYNETPVRQGKAFLHYGITPEEARDYAGTFLDQSFFLGAFLGDMMVGFAKLTMDDNRKQANLIHILSMAEHKEKAPTNALIAQAVRACAERKIPYLVYEHFNYGKKVGDSLSHFKEVNGFERVDVPRYYVPLNSLGHIALQLGLHHPLADRIPESVAGKLRDLRKTWHERRFQPQAES